MPPHQNSAALTKHEPVLNNSKARSGNAVDGECRKSIFNKLDCQQCSC